MKSILRIHVTRPATHLPTHELAARRLRSRVALPTVPRRTHTQPPPQTRKTGDTRFTLPV